MHLITWHGTLICQPDQDGMIGHHPLPLGAGLPAPLDITIPPSMRGTVTQHALGSLHIQPARQPGAVLVTRNSLFMCAEKPAGLVTLDREIADNWEMFLPVAAPDLAVLQHILSYRWIVRDTRAIVRRRTIGIAEGFRLHIGAFAVSLAETKPGDLILERGQNGLPVSLLLPTQDDTVELVVAEPRSSALIETAAWPPRARRVAEILSLAVHRQLEGTEPTQEIFERDTALLEATGPAGLEDLLEWLMLANGAGMKGQAATQAASIEIEARLAEARTLEEAARTGAALEAYERIAEAFSEDQRAWCRLGALLHGEGDVLAAQRMWERCLEIGPHTEAAIGLGTLAGSLGRPLEAASRMEQVLEREPDLTEIRVFLAARYAELGWLDRALDAFEQIGETLRSWMEATRRGTVARHAQERQILDRLVAGQPHPGAALNWADTVQKARSALSLGQMDLFHDALDALLASDAKRPEPHLLRADFLARSKGILAPLAYLGSLQGAVRHDPDIILALARLHYQARHVEQAQAMLQTLLAQTPRDEAFRLLALAAVSQGDNHALEQAVRGWRAFNAHETAVDIFAIAQARAAGRVARLDDFSAQAFTVPYPVIMQYWHAAKPPPDVAIAMASWAEKNPGLGHAVFDDTAARAFLAEYCAPEILACYDAAHHPAMQSDIFRLAYLHERGGIYIDADDFCARDMRHVFAALAHVELAAVQSTELPPYVYNGFIAARPLCPIIRGALDEAVRLVSQAVSAGREPDIWHTTGPGVLTRAIGRFLSDASKKKRVLLLTHAEYHAFAVSQEMAYKKSDAGDWRLGTAPPKAKPVPAQDFAKHTQPEDATQAGDVLAAWAMREMAPWQGKGLSAEDANRIFSHLNETQPWAALYHFDDDQVALAPKPDNVPLRQMHSERAQHYLAFFRSVARRLPPGFRTTICMGLADGLPSEFDAPVFTFQKPAGWNNVLLPDIDFLALDFYERAEFHDGVPYERKQPGAVFAGGTSGGIITPEVARALSTPRLRAAAYFMHSKSVDFRLPSIAQCTNQEAEEILRAQPFCQRPALSWQEQFRRRFLISMDGNGATCSRVAVALMSQCVLLKYNSDRVLYYFGGLQPWLHYVPLEEDADVERIIALEAQDSARFAHIAQAGRAFARTYLGAASARHYTAHLLQLYAAALAGEQAPARPALQTAPALVEPSGTMVAHIQNRGDQRAAIGSWAGEPGSKLAIEGIAIDLEGMPARGFTYRAMTAGGTETLLAYSGEYCGTRGKNLPLTGFRIDVDAAISAALDITYEAQFVDGTKLGPVAPGTMCQAGSGKPLEAVRVLIVRKNVLF